MEYKVKITDEFEEWLLDLNDKEKVDVLASINLIKALGPHLGYPHSSKINGLWEIRTYCTIGACIKDIIINV